MLAGVGGTAEAWQMRATSLTTSLKEPEPKEDSAWGQGGERARQNMARARARAQAERSDKLRSNPPCSIIQVIC